MASFEDGLDQQRLLDEKAGQDYTVPKRVAEGWLCKVKKDLGVACVTPASTEPKRVCPKENVNHFAEFHRKLEECGVDGDMVCSFDEFNEFMERACQRCAQDHCFRVRVQLLLQVAVSASRLSRKSWGRMLESVASAAAEPG